jgi:hypothetical protein
MDRILSVVDREVRSDAIGIRRPSSAIATGGQQQRGQGTTCDETSKRHISIIRTGSYSAKGHIDAY